MRGYDLTSRDVTNSSSAAELMEREWAPCRYNCPVHADVRTYIELVGQGRWHESIDVIRRTLPFAAVCGRICHHPCEANCRRNDVDDPVAIREVKRFVAEYCGSKGATVNKAAVQNKAGVAVIGAGPAGMSAALELAKLGYRPKVFEKFPVAGGISATAIPKYRLPRHVVQIDIDWILAHGVELQTNVEIGKDKTVDDLLDADFEAVLIATGLAKSRMLPIPGSDHKHVLGVMEFLTNLAFGKKVSVGNDVLVIGGGNVACDAARVALRLGAERVRMMCLENDEEMPAWEWESSEAKEEGIAVIHRRGPVEIAIDDGRIRQVKARKVTRVFDEDKRFNPQYDDSDIINIDCDTVIFAIGQMADYGFVNNSAVKLHNNSRLEFNSITHQTNVPNVFACGEIVTLPGSVVEACANGQRAAKAIDMYLSGRKVDIDDSLPPAIDKISEVTAEKVIKTQRVSIPTEVPEKRKKNFDEFEHTLDAETAACEARRCMNCGAGAEVLVDKCAACLTCLRVCPFDIPKVTDVARIDSILCQACGMCIAECPAKAIIPRGWDKDLLKHNTVKALESMDNDVKIVAYICGHRAPASAWRGENGAVAGVKEFYLPSMARLSTAELLNAFESGADAVIVAVCAEDFERYPQAAMRIRKRINQAREMLSEVGIDNQRLKIFEGGGDAESIRKILGQAAREVREIIS
jgi:NADPH-dependent glutamate synthase beta subunit-like oxidoreductase/coenzyme F420-reducing hydrogenase delta subunit